MESQHPFSPMTTTENPIIWSSAGADMPGSSKLLRLPEEILLHIFGFLYEPWYLEVEMRKNLLLEYYYEEPQIYALPSSPDHALLSTCKLTHRIARDAMLNAFIGLINSQEEYWTSALEDIQFPATWAQIEPRVKKLCLPSNKFTLVNSKGFILKLSAIENVELFEGCGVTAFMEGLVVGADENGMAIPDEYLRKRAQRFLPTIPGDITFSCNGGKVDLLLHVDFDFWRTGAFSPTTLNVSFKLGKDSLLEIVKKELRPKMMACLRSDLALR